MYLRLWFPNSFNSLAAARKDAETEAFVSPFIIFLVIGLDGNFRYNLRQFRFNFVIYIYKIWQVFDRRFLYLANSQNFEVLSIRISFVRVSIRIISKSQDVISNLTNLQSRERKSIISKIFKNLNFQKIFENLHFESMTKTAYKVGKKFFKFFQSRKCN